jgi:phytoene dehydrogenase-like protein
MNVGIVGGGVAGLYAALLLRKQGHKVTVLEASNRIGGRIYSHHFKPTVQGDDPFFEAGAMRLPLSNFHAPVFDFVHYLNEQLPKEGQIEFLPYVLHHHNNKVLYQGKVWDADDPDMTAALGLSRRYHGKTARQILLEVMNPWIKLLRDDFETGFAEVLRYDEMTFRHYLRTIALWPNDIIDYVEGIMSQPNQYDQSFTDLVMQTLHFNTPGKCLLLFIPCWTP